MTTVDLYVYSAHEIATWEPLWTQLRRRGVDAAFVVEPPGLNKAVGTAPDPTRGWLDDKAAAELVDLMDEDTFARITDLLDRRDIGWLEASRPDADAVITTQGASWISHYRSAAKIRTMYGVGAVHDSYGHGPVNAQLDAVLVHGRFSAAAIARVVGRDRVRVVGYPKWAAARRGELDRATARTALAIDPAAPVVAWPPTWAQHSSLDRYGAALAELATRWTVIAKPHHNNLHFERERLAHLDAGIALLDDADDLVPLVLAADVVVADARSGALTEGLLGDRPVIGLVPDGTPRDHRVLAGLDDAVHWAVDPAALTDAVAAALAGDDRHEARRRWATWFFEDLAGRDDEVAADAVLAVIDAHRNPLLGGPAPDLAAVDRVLERELLDAADLADAVGAWPDHPGLLAALPRIDPASSLPAQVALARAVRLTGRAEACPLRAVATDPTAPTLRRLVAAAAAGAHFDDPAALEAFPSLVTNLREAEFGPALDALGAVPDAIGTFLALAASSATRLAVLADAVAARGAEELADQLRRQAPTRDHHPDPSSGPIPLHPA